MDIDKIKKTCLELEQTRKDLQEQTTILKRATAKIKSLRQQEKSQITMILHHTQPQE
jgi:hypothetical protein